MHQKRTLNRVEVRIRHPNRGGSEEPHLVSSADRPSRPGFETPILVTGPRRFRFLVVDPGSLASCNDEVSGPPVFGL